MTCVLHEKCNVMFLKIYVTLLDGSEYGIIEWTDRGMHIQTLDSLNVASCQVDFPASWFHEYSWPVTTVTKFALRELQKLLMKRPSTTWGFHFRNEHAFDVVLGRERHRFKTHVNLRRLSFSSHDYFHWPQYTECPEKLNSAFLELATNGELCFVTFGDTPNQVKFNTRNEIGHITVRTAPGEKRLQNPPTERISNIYIMKFLKQMCTLIGVCQTATLFMTRDSPLILVLELADHVKCTMAIAPVDRDELQHTLPHQPWLQQPPFWRVPRNKKQKTLL